MSSRLTSFASLGSLVVLSGAFIACGASGEAASPARAAEPPPPASPPREEPIAEPRTVEEAQKQIAAAASALSGRALHYQEDHDSRPPMEPTPGKTEDRAISGESSNRCASPCRALASMKRAVEALCRMTGETDTKCVDARKTLADNVSKTASCKCSS